MDRYKHHAAAKEHLDIVKFLIINPRFCHSSFSICYTKCKLKNKIRGNLGTRLVILHIGVKHNYHNYFVKQPPPSTGYFVNNAPCNPFLCFSGTDH